VADRIASREPKAEHHAQRLTDPEVLYDELLRLRDHVAAEANLQLESWRGSISRPAYLPSAANLAAYLALRRHDLRSLQLALMPLGLSSLGRCESRTLENLDAVIEALGAITGARPEKAQRTARRFFRGTELLARQTEQLFGPTPGNRQVRIMVTLDAVAGTDRGSVEALVQSGMDVARINSAHGDPEIWRLIAANVRSAAKSAGRPCRVALDLTGPRVRTGRTSAGDERLRTGDQFHLVARAHDPPGSGHWAKCSLDALLSALKPGTTVWIDEGSLGAETVWATPERALLTVTHAPPKGARLRDDKAINVPELELTLDPLTEKDLADLDVAVEIADILGYSFVQRREDIVRLQAELAHRQRPGLPLIAKIETRAAVERLPELIVQAAGSQPLAVMIARGDLAVEIGYSRLAEIQEELLWLCEAGHVPVVWATQVLNTFVHKGTHARGELTDAAMAERAECVMLNKGPFVADAVRLLDDVLARMEGHQSKKTSRLRALRSWQEAQ
jgi:pyruvate kinase